MIELELEKDHVRFILEEEPETANSDEELFKTFLKVYYPGIPFPFKNIVKVCNSLTRIRRKLNQEWLCLPTDTNVLRKRRQLEKAHADEYRTTKREHSDQAKFSQF